MHSTSFSAFAQLPARLPLPSHHLLQPHQNQPLHHENLHYPSSNYHANFSASTTNCTELLIRLTAQLLLSNCSSNEQDENYQKPTSLNVTIQNGVQSTEGDVAALSSLPEDGSAYLFHDFRVKCVLIALYTLVFVTAFSGEQ